MLLRIATLIIMFFGGQSSFAVTILTAYHDALSNDPVYMQACAQFAENKEAAAIAGSSLLPQANALGSYDKQNQTIFNGNKTFDVYNYTLSVNQVLIDWTAYKNFTSAKASVCQAYATLFAAQQDLILRLASAYFGVLLSQDIVLYSKKQRDSLKKQLETVRIRYNHNDATITSLEQSQASYDFVNSQYYTAQITLQDRIQELSMITGKHYVQFSKLNPDFLPNPKTEKLDVLLNYARLNNFTLNAARFGLQAANEALKATMGTFLPTLGMNANYNKTNEPFYTGENPPITTKNIGLDLNYAIFTGGLRPANVRVSKARLQIADALFRQNYLLATTNTRRFLANLKIGVKQVKAGKSAVQSNEKALSHTQEGYIAGTQTILDIVEIERQLFNARSTYSRDRYALIITILSLKQAIGNLNDTDLNWINTHLNV